jgi:hypothetical protein
MEDGKTLTLLCSQCNTELRESETFEFGGSIACEKCVRRYYRDRASELDLELPRRRRGAVAWIARNRRVLESQAEKRFGNK